MPPLTPHLLEALQKRLSNRAQTSSLRALTLSSAGSVDFSSNDFLSLATSPLLKSAFSAELQTADCSHAIGSRGSRLLDGNSRYAEELERSIAAFHGAPAGLLFNSGFDANAGFFACVPQPGDVVIYDEFIHASVHEGMRGSRAAACIAFRHNDMADLERKIGISVEDESMRLGKKNIFVVVESLYSMDGDLAPLKDTVDIVERLLPNGNGHVIVDEAHSTGIYGPNGRGVVCELKLEKRVFARLHTFGKALGCNGSIILCDDIVRSYLINYARPLIYTTFMSFPSLAAIRASYSLLQSGATETLSSHLQQLISHLYSQLRDLPTAPPLLNIPSQQPLSPIFSILSSEPRNLARYCQDGGFVVRPIVSPTVPVGTERVRICLHAGNSFAEVDGLVQRIGKWVKMETKTETENGRQQTQMSKARL